MNTEKSLFEKYKDLTEERNLAKDPAIATLIYGPVKVGKTSLAATASELGNTILLNFEKRVAHIKNHPNLVFFPDIHTICTNQNLINLSNAIASNPEHQIKYIIFDTVDSYFWQLQAEKMEKKGKVALNWDDRKEIVLDIIPFLEKIKNVFGINLIIVAHDKELKNNDGKKNGRIAIDLDSDIKKIVNRLADHIFYLDYNMQNQRVLHTRGNWQVEAGQSTRQGEELPDQIINPSWKKIFYPDKLESTPENLEKIQTEGLK